MQIVIDIPEETYKKICGYSLHHIDFCYSDDVAILAIKNGTPLPQPFDLDGLKSDMKALNCGYPYGLDYLLDCLKKRLGITIGAEQCDDDCEHCEWATCQKMEAEE